MSDSRLKEDNQFCLWIISASVYYTVRNKTGSSGEVSRIEDYLKKDKPIFCSFFYLLAELEHSRLLIKIVDWGPSHRSLRIGHGWSNFLLRRWLLGGLWGFPQSFEESLSQRIRAAPFPLLRISQTGINRVPEAHTVFYWVCNLYPEFPNPKKLLFLHLIWQQNLTWNDPEAFDSVYLSHSLNIYTLHCMTINIFDNKGCLRTHWE